MPVFELIRKYIVTRHKPKIIELDMTNNLCLNRSLCRSLSSSKRDHLKFAICMDPSM